HAPSYAKTDILRFISRTIGYLQPNRAEMLQISRIVTLNIDGSNGWNSCFLSVLNTTNEMKDVAIEGMVNGVIELIKNEGPKKIGHIIDWMYLVRLANSGYFDVSLPRT